MSARDVIVGVLTFPGGGLLADGIVERLAAAGYVVVPREPTGEMVEAAILRDHEKDPICFNYGNNCAGIFSAMIAAALEDVA